MIDVVSIENGFDLGVSDSIVPRAANVLSVQLGDLEYAPAFGVDLKFFLDPDLQFQNESFKAYLVQRLTDHHINVSQVLQTFDALFTRYTFGVADAAAEAKGLIK